MLDAPVLSDAEYDRLMGEITRTYQRALEKGIPAEDARFVLPNAVSSGVDTITRSAQAALAKAAEPPVQPKAPLVAGFDANDPNTWGNPGRNDPCPCGSGEKFKHCHGRLA